MNRNYELSYWERMAEEQLSKPQFPVLQNRGMGIIHNNRKRTKGRRVHVIDLNPEKWKRKTNEEIKDKDILKKSSSKQIRILK